MVCLMKKLLYLGIRMIIIFCYIVCIICECNKLYNVFYLNNQIDIKRSLLSIKQIYKKDVRIRNNALYNRCFVFINV